MASTWHEGFLVLPRLLSPTEVDEFVNIIRGYLRVRGDDHAFMMSGRTIGGWYIGDFPSIPALAGLLQTLRSKPALARVLKELLGEEHRLLSRSEICVHRKNRTGGTTLVGC